jgi:hypothetical protein
VRMHQSCMCPLVAFEGSIAVSRCVNDISKLFSCQGGGSGIRPGSARGGLRGGRVAVGARALRFRIPDPWSSLLQRTRGPEARHASARLHPNHGESTPISGVDSPPFGLGAAPSRARRRTRARRWTRARRCTRARRWTRRRAPEVHQIPIDDAAPASTSTWASPRVSGERLRRRRAGPLIAAVLTGRIGAAGAAGGPRPA